MPNIGYPELLAALYVVAFFVGVGFVVAFLRGVLGGARRRK